MVAPFPFSRLPKARRYEGDIWRALEGQLSAHAATGWQTWIDRCLGSSGKTVELKRGGIRRLSAMALASGGPPPDVVGFLLEGPQGIQVGLFLDQRSAGLLVRAILRAPLDRVEGVVTGAERGLLGFAIAWLLGVTIDRASWRVLEQVPDLAASTANDMCVGLDFRMDRWQGAIWLVLDSSKALRLVPELSRSADVACVEPFASWRVTFSAQVGCFRIAATEVIALEPGDVIVNAGLRKDTERRGWLRSGSGGFPFEMDDDRIAIGGPFCTGAPWMTADMSQGTSNLGRSDLTREIEVEAVVELGRVELPLAQAMALGVGDVLTLGKPLGALLELRVGGKAFGRVELVDVDQEIGVRLVELVVSPDSSARVGDQAAAAESVISR